MKGQHAAPRHHRLDLTAADERISTPEDLPARRLPGLFRCLPVLWRRERSTARAATRYRELCGSNSRAGSQIREARIIIAATLPPLPRPPVTGPPRIIGDVAARPAGIWAPPRCPCGERWGPCLLTQVRDILAAVR